MTNFQVLMDMNADNTMVTENDDLLDLYGQLHGKPKWEFDNDDD